MEHYDDFTFLDVLIYTTDLLRSLEAGSEMFGRLTASQLGEIRALLAAAPPVLPAAS